MTQLWSLLRFALRETLGPPRLTRGPTPLAVLGDEGFLAAMRDGGRSTGRLAAGFLYHSARISQLLTGRRRCADLGCGDGTQTVQVAALNPSVEFVGIDRSPLLLEAAAALAQEAGVHNVSWVCDTLPALPRTGDRSFDVVMSTMTLHDLPTLDEVARTLAGIRRIAADDAGFYLEDFARLKADASVDCLVQMNSPGGLDGFSRLYGLSLRAAYTLPELKQVFARELPQVTVHATAPIPFLIVAKTADRSLSDAQRAQIVSLRAALPVSAQRDLLALCRAFRLGGLDGDPFA